MPRVCDNNGLQCRCLLVGADNPKRVIGSETEFTIAGNTILSILFLTLSRLIPGLLPGGLTPIQPVDRLLPVSLVVGWFHNPGGLYR